MFNFPIADDNLKQSSELCMFMPGCLSNNQSSSNISIFQTRTSEVSDMYGKSGFSQGDLVFGDSLLRFKDV